MLKRTVRQFIEREELLEKGNKTLVALSGGADSVALLRVLLQLGYPCEAAHCNFHLRGEESNRDEAFVRTLCEEWQVALHVQHFDTQASAENKGISIEMAARELRYDWFEQLRQATGCPTIAVAHHQGDSVETFLLNLIRGTGIKGLQGIRPKNGAIVRPLLCVNRQEILDYLQHLGQAYVTDSTNLQTDYTRNKIRLELLPLLSSINPSINEGLLQTASHLNEVLHIYNKSITEGLARVKDNQGINIDLLMQEPSPQCLLYEAVAPLGFNASQVNDMMEALQGQSGKVFESKEWRIVKDRTHLLIEEIKVPTPPVLEQEELSSTPHFIIPKDKNTACLDANKLKGELHVRLCQPGDWFIPFGMKGKKLVSDFLTDQKKSISEKAQQYVLCCGNEVVWVIGERIDNRFRVDEDTKRVIIVRKKA
jgi:tRNA(Ile)-lysidine synthase